MSLPVFDSGYSTINIVCHIVDSRTDHDLIWGLHYAINADLPDLIVLLKF